jgi:hypothetical protein
MIVTEHHPVVGDFRTLGNPVLVPGDDFAVRSAPAHGQHTDEVLAELGYDADARAALRADRVICPPPTTPRRFGVREPLIYLESDARTGRG